MYRKGVIRNVDTTFTDEEIKTVIQTKIPIKDIRRINRKVVHNNVTNYVNTETMVLTFRGQFLPDYVSIYRARCRVALYVYRVTQCAKCFRFGHVSRQCRGSGRCSNCEENHSSQNSPAVQKNIFINCKGTHHLTDKNCPINIDQKKIKICMAKHNISFREAKGVYRSFSEVTAAPMSLREFPQVANNRFAPLMESDQNEDITTTTETVFHCPKKIIPKPRVSKQTHSYRANNNLTDTPTSENLNVSLPDERPSRAFIARNLYAPQPHLLTNKPNITYQSFKLLYSSILHVISKNNDNFETTLILNETQIRECYNSLSNSLNHGSV